MGLFEKRRFRNLLIFVMNYEEGDESTWQGLKPTDPMKVAYAKFGCDGNTQDFTGERR